MTAVSPLTYPLGLGAVAVGTSEYSMTGLFAATSTHLDTTSVLAGQLLTAFADTCAVAGPIRTTTAARRRQRRRLLVTALAVTATGHAAAAVAPTVPSLFIARVVTGLGAAVYIAGAASMAARLNEPEQLARAIGIAARRLTRGCGTPSDDRSLRGNPCVCGRTGGLTAGQDERR